MSSLLIKNGTVVDPSQNLNGRYDLRVTDGRISEIGSDLSGDETKFDAVGLTLVPGLIDVHVHFREPGDEEEETIASGSEAAARGGFTSVACMPNTEPPMDSEAAISFVYLQAQKAGKCNVYPIGAITRGREGKVLAEMGSMVRGGAVAFSDDGCAVKSAGVLRRAMEYARMLDKPIMEHCEDLSLALKGVMNEGAISTQLGLAGIPAEAEEIIVARDIMLASLTGVRLHVQHVSTEGSVEQIRRAKAKGVNVSAEVTPHHLFLTDEKVRGYDPAFKMNPPLRSAGDLKACLAGLRDGTIEIIASDHAPHSREEKAVEFSSAAFGAIGLESTVGIILRLVNSGEFTLENILPCLTTAPATLLGIERGTLQVGKVADITILDLQEKWVINPDDFAAKSSNCPFAGAACVGRNVATVLNGKVVYEWQSAKKCC